MINYPATFTTRQIELSDLFIANLRNGVSPHYETMGTTYFEFSPTIEELIAAGIIFWGKRPSKSGKRMLSVLLVA